MILNDKIELDYVIYMYNEIYIGAADNWKEAINDLKNQLKHEELKSGLRIVNQNIIASNLAIKEMNNSMNRQFSKLDNMISNQFDRIDKRIDGLFEIYEWDHYYYHRYRY